MLERRTALDSLSPVEVARLRDASPRHHREDRYGPRTRSAGGGPRAIQRPRPQPVRRELHRSRSIDRRVSRWKEGVTAVVRGHPSRRADRRARAVVRDQPRARTVGCGRNFQRISAAMAGRASVSSMQACGAHGSPADLAPDGGDGAGGRSAVGVRPRRARAPGTRTRRGGHEGEPGQMPALVRVGAATHDPTSDHRTHGAHAELRWDRAYRDT
jgi:hypothetical protein